MATAAFLQSQIPNGSAYIIGEAGLITALYNAGYSSNNIDPDYVVMGEARSYSYEVVEKFAYQPSYNLQGVNEIVKDYR